MKNVNNKLIQPLLRTTYYESNIVIIGNRCVLIENVKHIYELNEIMARVKTTQGDVVIWGENLKASSFKGANVTISGKISSCELEVANDRV